MKPEFRTWCRIVLAGLSLALAVTGPAACRRADAESRQRGGEVATAMKRLLELRLGEWQTAARDLRQAAPLPADRGWDPERDASALTAMKEAWTRAREAYERVEGAVAPLFPESDLATDARYDHFLTVGGASGDRAPFDGDGVIGMHAIERILWADAIPAVVVEFEQALPGYAPARFPATAAEAAAFRDGLAARLVSDVERLTTDVRPLRPDVAFTYRGVVDLAVEQAEKVNKAASGEEESRYAQTTMRDLRANMIGCSEAYALFRPWVADHPKGRAADARVMEAFARLKTAYARVPGDAFPRPPETWSSVAPQPADLATPFGALFSVIRREVDPGVSGSLVHALGDVASLLQLPAAVLK